MIFIPGFACSGEVWDETVAKYKDNYTCYIFTLAGFAGIPAVKNPSFSNYEDQIFHYIESFKIGNPIVVGHSLGGVIIINRIDSMDDKQFYQVQKSTTVGFANDSAKRNLILQWSMKSDRHTFGQMYCDFSNVDLREKIGKITCPSLIMLEPSFNIFSKQMETQYQHLQSVRIHYAEKGLHFIMYDDKDWFDRELDQFIR